MGYPQVRTRDEIEASIRATRKPMQGEGPKHLEARIQSDIAYAIERQNRAIEANEYEIDAAGNRYGGGFVLAEDGDHIDLSVADEYGCTMDAGEVERVRDYLTAWLERR